MNIRLFSFTLLLGIFFNTNAFTQDSIFQKVDVMPEFPGGSGEMMKWLGSNVNYPQDAREKGISGTVFASFVVEKDGSLSNIKILRGISESLDNEVLKVVKLFPKWEPAIKDGVKVRCQFNIPVKFILANEGKNKKKKKR